MASEEELFADWATDSTKQLDGKFIFLNPTDESTHKELAFEQAFCVDYHETFRPEKFKFNDLTIEDFSGSKITYIFVMGISPAKVTISGVTHDNGW